MQKRYSKTNNFSSSLRNGYSLVELLIVTVVALSVLAAAARMYVRFVDVERREERILLVERSLLAIQNNLEKSLVTLPGRGFATSGGEAFSLPLLPSIGTTRDKTGKIVPVRLGLVTPFKYNGFDAFTIPYTDAKIPRLPIASNTKIDLNTGKITVALPQAVIPRPPIIRINPGGITPGGTIGGLTGSTIKISDSSNDNTTSNIIIPPHTPTPTPTPTPTSTPHIPVPPNVPFNSTILGENWIPDISMFHVGDVMLLTNEPAYSDTQTFTTQTTSRLIQITAIRAITPTLNQGGQFFIEFTFDFCNVGDCGTQFPGLTNTFDAPRVGAVLIPLRLASFYVKSDGMGTRIVRNDGGVPTLDSNGNVTIQGGIENTQGELLGNVGVTANFNVVYHLSDGTTQTTPNNPAVAWLNNIISTDVTVTSEVSGIKGTERINHAITVSFPTIMKTLEQ